MFVTCTQALTLTRKPHKSIFNYSAYRAHYDYMVMSLLMYACGQMGVDLGTWFWMCVCVCECVHAVIYVTKYYSQSENALLMPAILLACCQRKVTLMLSV